MSNPRRWLDGGDELTPDERRALEADLGRGVPPHAKRAVRAALSLELAAASAAAAAPNALRGSAQKGAAAKLLSLSLLKSVAVGFALSAAVGIGVSMRAPHRAAPASGGTARRPSPPERAAPASSGAAQPSESSSSLPDSPPSRTSRRAVARNAIGEAASLPAAASESQRVAEARALLRSGRASEALATLQLLERDEPNGLLVQEREALSIQTLAALGQRDAARQRAAVFAARYPASPHLTAVRRAAE